MGLFSNPLGHAGFPPGVTGTPTTQNASIRAATAAEAAAGTLTNCYISPATQESATALDFASPPALGFGSTTPRPVHATTLDSTSTTSLGTASASVVNVGVANSTIGFFGATAVTKPGSTAEIKASLANLGLLTGGGATPLNLDGGALTASNAVLTTGAVATVGVAVNTSAGTGAGGTFTTSAANINAIECVTGSIKVPANSVAGATPVENNVRTGQASFTDVIANGAYGTLTVTNSIVSGSSVIIASASCTTANSAVQIVDYVPGSGTVAFRVFNAGSASTDVNININFWILN